MRNSEALRIFVNIHISDGILIKSNRVESNKTQYDFGIIHDTISGDATSGIQAHDNRILVTLLEPC
jgi:hypothetical protein